MEAPISQSQGKVKGKGDRFISLRGRAAPQFGFGPQYTGGAEQILFLSLGDLGH